MPYRSDNGRHDLVGVEHSRAYKFSIYDSLIIAAALDADCTTLYSEDMQHRQIIENQLTFVNPFLVDR
ncbi:MAG: hypothetical protein LUQ11_00730 [Methylococcaceae bacterium]|nr:hypothetical protein [Methylococcaceae bacterium]